MKCPYCKIHYMDDERECPICGKPNPARWSAKHRTAQKKPRTKDAAQYPSIRHRSSSSKKSTAKQKSLWDSLTTPSDTTTATLSTSPSKKNAQKKKSSTRLGAILSVAVVLISLIPTGISAVQDALQDVDLPAIFQSVPAQPDDTDNVPVNSDYILPERAADQLGGEWVGLDDTGYLAFDLDNLDYSYSPDDTQNLEHGRALIYEVDQFEDENGTAQYSYQVDFYPDWADYGYSMYVAGSGDTPNVLGTIVYDENQDLNADNMVIWKRLTPQNA